MVPTVSTLSVALQWVELSYSLNATEPARLPPDEAETRDPALGHHPTLAGHDGKLRDDEAAALLGDHELDEPVVVERLCDRRRTGLAGLDRYKLDAI